jgi:hypothetical protein
MDNTTRRREWVGKWLRRPQNVSKLAHSMSETQNNHQSLQASVKMLMLLPVVLLTQNKRGISSNWSILSHTKPALEFCSIDIGDYHQWDQLWRVDLSAVGVTPKLKQP